MPKDQKINEGFVTLIESVIFENDILQRQTTDSSAKALIASLSPISSCEPSDATFTYLDECLGRLPAYPTAVAILEDLR